MFKCKYFQIQEIVSKIVYEKYGEFCWRFFSKEFKMDLDVIREFHKHDIIINDWYFGGKHNYSQCGFRSNLDQIVKNKTNKNIFYCSAHCMGKAVDMHSRDNILLFEDCKKLIMCGRLLTIRRLEDPSSTKNYWVHADSFETANDSLEIFNG